MRFGMTILPEHRWAEAAPMWRAAEEFGFDHAWTYDHLTWGGLPDAPWFSATTTLTAAAMITQTIRLGTFVASPNFRHPATFLREITALDDISGGRLDLGLGTGGDLDSRILGGDELSIKQRVDRFEEFVSTLDRLLTEERVDHHGSYFTVNNLQTAPGPTQQPRTPFIMAGNGPRALRLVARFGQGWVTTGIKGDNQQQWWDSLKTLSSRLDDTLSAAGRESDDFPRYLNIDAGHQFSLESAAVFEDMVGQAAELGFTDVITHWPRPDGPYAGSRDTLERVVQDILPTLRDR